MAKQNCNNGCLEIISGTCVKFTGLPILKPPIAGGTDFNTVVSIFASALGSSGGGALCGKPVTYQQLVDLSESGGIVKGCWYILTDFRTVHEIINISEDATVWGGISYTNTGEINTGQIEQLSLLATTDEEYFTGFGTNGDQIQYSLYGRSNHLPGSTHGAIERRKDLVLNIDMPLDWRTIVWKVNGQRFYTFNGNDGSPSNYRDLTRNIYVGGGAEYKGLPVTIFTSNSPSPVDINISICNPFIVYDARSVHVVSASIFMPNATLLNIKADKIGKVTGRNGEIGNAYNPAWNIPD
jgi:hypothetical protein